MNNSNFSNQSGITSSSSTTRNSNNTNRARSGASSRKMKMEDALVTLRSMFSMFDDEVFKLVLIDTNGHLERAIDVLLVMQQDMMDNEDSAINNNNNNNQENNNNNNNTEPQNDDSIPKVTPNLPPDFLKLDESDDNNTGNNSIAQDEALAAALSSSSGDEAYSMAQSRRQILDRNQPSEPQTTEEFKKLEKEYKQLQKQMAIEMRLEEAGLVASGAFSAYREQDEQQLKQMERAMQRFRENNPDAEINSEQPSASKIAANALRKLKGFFKGQNNNNNAQNYEMLSQNEDSHHLLGEGPESYDDMEREERGESNDVSTRRNDAATEQNYY